MIRKAAVAGQFYQDSPAKLSNQVQQYVVNNLPREHAIGIVAPHAGLMYSGAVAGEVYSRIAVPDTFILLGPNHTGLGAPLSLMSEGGWEIPSGIFQVDEKLSRKLLRHVPLVSSDTQAHIFEHSLEVQLPFIAHFSKKVRIVPLTIMSASIDDCRALGEGMALALKETDYPVVIVASSDMSHYVSESVARKKDKMALDRILSLDPEGLFAVVRKEKISMCGYIPVTALLFAVKSLGAREARLIRYATSGEVSGDYDQVVGYAGVIIS